MKKLLISLGILVVVVIAALLVGPGFVNWNDHKAEIIAAVHDATGRQLAIDGDISLTILPAPALSVRDLRLAGLSSGASTKAPDMLTLKALEIRVALAPLISGEIQMTSVRLIQPKIILEALPSGRANWQFQPAGGQSTTGTATDGTGSTLALSLDSIAIEDATLIYRDNSQGAGGLEERIETIDLEGSAGSLQGPFKFKGTATARNLPLAFVISVDGISDEKPTGVRLNLKLDGDKAALLFSGRIDTTAEIAQVSGRMELSLPNVAAAQRLLIQGAQPPAVLAQSLLIKASLEATAKTVAINDIDLTFGPLQASGAINASLGDAPSYDVALAVGRLDLDRLLKGITDAEKAKAVRSTSKAGGQKKSSAVPTIPALPAIPGNVTASLAITIEGLKYRSGVVSQVQLDASIEDGALRLERLSALLPGGSDLRLSGDGSSVDGTPQFDGKVELASNNMRGLLGWLDANPTSIPAGRLANLVLTSNFNITQQQAQISNMNLRLDGTTVEGAATVLLQARPSFGLALNIDRINLDGYLPTKSDVAKSSASKEDAAKVKEKTGAGTAPKVGPLALLDQFDANIVLNIGDLTYNAAPIRGVSVELGLAAGILAVRRAAVRDLAGARLTFSGGAENFSGNAKGKGKLRVRAKYVDGLARLAGIELPVPPKRLRGLTLDGTVSGDMARLNFDLTTSLSGLRGTANGQLSNLAGPTSVSASVPASGPASVPMSVDLNLALGHGSLAGLSRTFELGIKPLPRADTKLSLQGKVKGKFDALAVDLTAALAGGEIQVKGRIDKPDSIGTGAKIDVAATAAHKDLTALLAALGQKFGGSQNPGAVSLAANVESSGDQFNLSSLKGNIGTITLGGTGSIRLDGPRPMVTADLQVGDVVLDHFLNGRGGNGGNGRNGRETSRRNGGGAAAGSRRHGDERWSRDAIDLSGLQTMDAKISLTGKRLVFQRYPFEEPRLHLTINDGVMRIEELSGRLFKGNVGLRATLNSRPVPGLGLSVQLQGADINQAMRTALEMDQVTGRLDFSGQFQTVGSSQWDLVNALSGQAKVHAENGVIRGFDMKNFSQRLGKLNNTPDFLNLAQRAFSGGETRYQSVDGNWQIKNGVARTDDMLASLDAARATVKGAVNLPEWHMDLRAVLALTEHRDAPDMGAHLFGPLDQPRHDLKTAKLERWLLARLGRELLGSKGKSGDLGKLLDAVTGGGRASSSNVPQPSGVQPSRPRSAQPAEQPAEKVDPAQQLLQGLFKALKK